VIRCVRIWTAADGHSDFAEGIIDLPKGERGDMLSDIVPSHFISFRETKAGGEFQWHDAPTRQLVLTLAGVLHFETHRGREFTINAGDVLLAEDTRGSGHRWKLVGTAPWRRAYVIVGSETIVPFKASLVTSGTGGTP
jgi:hypothetical protein